MKDKPVSHKNLNTFHFLTYAERLKNVDVCIYRQADTYLSTSDGKNTYLWEAFEKWRDLDYSISYEEFRKDIGDEIETLEQLVLRKDAIVEVLLKHLKREENLALPALLELTVALARDLQHELYPHFPDFFKTITWHLSTKDTELLEKLFLCLAFLFKFFTKYIVKDIKNVYALFSELLSDTKKEYIRIFACEAFAALMRKVRAREDLFTFIFCHLQQYPEQTFGVGQLFFETVKGVKEQFHYCLEPVFKLLLRFLGREDLSADLIEESLHQMLISMAKHTVQKHCVQVQEIFSAGIGEIVDDIQGKDSSTNDEKVKHLNCVLRLLCFWIRFKNGKLITPENGLMNVMVNLSGLNTLPQYCIASVVEVLSSAILTNCLKFPIEKVKTIISQICSHSDECAILFTRSTLKYGMFEKDILPVFLSVCLKMIQSGDEGKRNQVLEVLSECIMALKPFSESGDDVKSFSKLYLHINSPVSPVEKEDKTASYIVMEDFLMEYLECSVIESNLVNLKSALICLPHFRFVKREHVCDVVQELCQKIHQILLRTEITESVKSKELRSVLYQAYFAYLVITSAGTRSDTIFNTNFFMDLLMKFPDCIHILRMVDYYINNLTKAPVIEDLPEMISTIVPNLASPFHLVRLFTLRILKTFDLQDQQIKTKVASVFAICFEAENIPLDVQTYREKLKWLRKLEYEFIEKNLPAAYAEHITKAAIHYLLGMLYVNFKLLWEPSINILQTYANGPSQLFWDVFYPHLEKSFELCVRFNSGEDVYPVAESPSNEKVDIFNHHALIWKAMEGFPDLVERKNKALVPILLQFMVKLVEPPEPVKEDDVELLDEDTEADLSLTEEKDDTLLEEGSDNENDDDQEIDHPKILKPKKKKAGARRFQVTKILAAYLNVFSKFKNPKGGYKADELQKLYKELLSNTDPKIQKLAFDCIMTFGYKYLTPYKENFYRILDNKTFKTEVVLFSIDTENKVIAEEHRMDSLAILMRILYGKMLHKIDSRPMVLRFLAGCTAKELNMFFDLVFLPFKEQMNDDALTAVKKIKESTDVTAIVPVRKQHSALNTLGLIFQHLGNLIPELLPSLLKSLLIITATSSTLLTKRNEVLPHCLNLLKSVRTQAVVKLIQFFKTFEDYKYSPEEIDAIFESIIWRMLPRLEFESVNQPSPLLRLFATWSENTRYFVLFSKHHENDISLTPLRHMMELYCSSRCKPRVVGVLSKIVYQLLCAEEKISEEDESKKIPPIEINHSVTLPDIEIDTVPCRLGTKLLFPYVDKILRRFEMTATALSKRKIKKSLPIRDLTILLRISEFVEDPKLSFKLIELLPPFLMKPKLDADSEVLILNTISSLLRKSENPDYFIKLLAPFFGKLTNQNSRTALVGVFSTIAEIRPEMTQLTSIVSKINAYDLRLIGEPDYQLRLDGHKETLEIVKTMDETTINEDFIRIIIFNSSHMIRTCDDLALRNSSSYLLQELSKILHTVISSSKELTKLLLLETLLQEIQKGIRCPSEAVRHEFIHILQAILEAWKELPALKELVALCHEDKDLDFWENIRHLQFHRRARGLLRFANLIRKQCEDGEKISVYYLTSYMIPIVSSFLFDSAYKKQVHVIDAAIETLECVALALPWNQYEPLLKQYLQMLSTDIEHHKTIIKIIVSLLNAFHFETSSKRPAPSSESSVIKKPALESENAEAMETEVELPVQSISTDISTDAIATSEESFKIYISIRRNIMPLLHRSLMRKTKSDDEHKWAGNYYPEDEDILKVPIALAMVKLLQKLPNESLEKNLPGLFLKMCDLLKTKTESIRETTRETLVKMMDSLGPKYFRCLLTEMIGVMKRGYQVHVMVFTINAVLHKLAEKMKPGDLNGCAKDLTQICTKELFTDMAEEKEVEKITGKLKEARSVKSYSIFKILSQFISEENLLGIIQPLKEELTKRYSHKITKKVSECLKSIAEGISRNQGKEDKKILKFIHLIINESMPGLNKKKQEDAAKPKFERPDCLLIPREPGRSGPAAKLNKKTSDHVFVEFGLQILLFSLKKDAFDKNKKEILEMLDPFVPLLADCLTSNNIKIITLALQCLKPFYKYPLPAFRTVTRKIVNFVFLIVNKYAAVGMAQGENFEMVVMSFKLLTVLVRDSQYHTMNEEQLKSLLSYVEQDMYDYLRQATAFTLLKAILSKKLQAPELRGIMSKVAEMSITSEQSHVRSQCRQVCMQYMLDYPLGKHLEKSISFFISQLEYPMEHGRVSALEMIYSILTSFPENVLKRHSALFLIPLSARLVNDVPECRKMVAQCIKALLTKIEHNGRSSIFSVPMSWFQASKVSMKRLGAQLCGMFAEIEGEDFEHRLHEILPVVTQLVCDAKTEEIKSQADERSKDHFLYHILNSLIKMLSSCPVIRKEDFADSLKLLFDELQGLILYPHVWVRFATNQLYELMLSPYSVDEVVKAIRKKKKDNSVFLNTRQMLRDLSADFSTQLQSPFLNEEFGKQIVRNLIYVARILAQLPEESTEGEEAVDVTLDWMVRKLCREAKKEVADNRTVYERRKCVFKFIFEFMTAYEDENISNQISIEKEKLLPLLSCMLVPLCREITDASKYSDEDVKRIAQMVLDLIKTKVGVEEFSDMYAKVQTTLFKKKVKRKQEKAQEAITDPQKFAQKRIKKQINKKESKKRKIMKLKGKKKVVKRNKLSDLVIAS